MNIQPINHHSQKQPNFKSTFPVVHWVAEANGSFAPVANMEITKKLQGKIIRALNKPLSETDKPMKLAEQKLRAYLGFSDIDYRKLPIVRSFYNRSSASVNYFSPIVHMITGDDVEIFNNTLAKDIGRSKSGTSGEAHSEATKQALKIYNKQGLNFVKNPKRRIKDEQGMMYILHTKFEIIRNKLGEIKDYRFLDARFLPAEGAKNPLKNY